MVGPDFFHMSEGGLVFLFAAEVGVRNFLPPFIYLNFYIIYFKYYLYPNSMGHRGLNFHKMYAIPANFFISLSLYFSGPNQDYMRLRGIRQQYQA